MFCSVKDCDRKIYSRDLCEMHYRRWQRRGTTDRSVEPGLKVCSVDGCDKVSEARGLCHGHYLRVLRGSRLTDADPLERRTGVRVCSVEGCDRRAPRRGLCEAHAARLKKYGDVHADRPLLGRRGEGEGPPRILQRCSVDGCNKTMLTQGLCKTHYSRKKKFGDVRADLPIRSTTGNGTIHHGYRYIPVPKAERHLTNGRDTVQEHRLVMARLLGRSLTQEESVHHLNGDRLDNRAENLELWTRSQPFGSRVEDMLRWAIEILERYAPELGRLKPSD